jgi:hypothetical protein
MQLFWPRNPLPKKLALGFLFCAVCGFILAAPAPKDRTTGYQAKADQAAWNWIPERASLDYCLRESPISATSRPSEQSGIIISLRLNGKQEVEFAGHAETVFAVGNNVVYYAEFHPHSTGCEVVAINLETGKQLWRHPLKGMGSISHSKYRNQVILDIDELTVRVLGKESAGRYVEYVDRESGRTVGHRVFKSD